MSEKDIKNEELAAMQEEAEEEVNVVVLTDPEGNEHYFMEEMIIPYNGKSFAVLVGIDDECCEDEECECHHHDEDDEDTCIIARIDFDENGEAVYVGPTDEEYEAVAELYDQLCEEEE
ncbi:MAG: DUF1292 domain-containing protein [Phascolarctobacterium sp.]|nr:DUF1292 domain-containing protein [Phascolarctobacterium sp.]